MAKLWRPEFGESVVFTRYMRQTNRRDIEEHVAKHGIKMRIPAPWEENTDPRPATVIGMCTRPTEATVTPFTEQDPNYIKANECALGWEHEYRPFYILKRGYNEPRYYVLLEDISLGPGAIEWAAFSAGHKQGAYRKFVIDAALIPGGSISYWEWLVTFMNGKKRLGELRADNWEKAQHHATEWLSRYLKGVEV